jgi:hypothetical protein
VQSLWSTGFFVFDGEGALSTSGVVWIFLAVVIPLTVLTFLVWFAWIKLARKETRKVMDDLDRGLALRRRKIEDGEEH